MAQLRKAKAEFAAVQQRFEDDTAVEDDVMLVERIVAFTETLVEMLAERGIVVETEILK